MYLAFAATQLHPVDKLVNRPNLNEIYQRTMIELK